MKRFGAFLAAALLSVGLLAGCGGGQESSGLTVLKVGATPVPHAEILRFIQPKAKEQGIDLQVVEFTDFVQPNMALADGQLDANYFQHEPYLNTFVQERKVDLVSVGPVHLEPLGMYSVKVSDISQLRDGAVITIPSDPSNGGRALYLLAQNGLIKLREGVGIEATVHDIVENPKNLNIKQLDAEQLPRTLEDADAAVINTNYYLEAQKNLGLNANVLARESAENNPYANIVAVRKGDENRPEIKKLMELLQSEEVRQFIESNYQGAVIPAF
ncbi:MAG TPA: MetQ/NlpA family ABC transporter substrate-binding protein [Symbiobacteriaceae bacterium]